MPSAQQDRDFASKTTDQSVIFEPGNKVHYWPSHAKSKYDAENGIVKRVSEDDPEIVFVVYKCGGNWEHYENYTAANTPIKYLRHGWL